MDKWETEYIQSNLVSLINEIDPSPILPSLLQSRIISKLEKEKLDIIGRTEGRMDQSNKLLDIVGGRINGYQQLVKALYIASQTGPMITLLYGVQINTLANPFQYCGIQLKLDEFLPKNVNFLGHQIRLADICKYFNEQQLTALREAIDVSIYKSLISCDEITVAKDTIPTVIPYYIKRTLTLRNKLDASVFRKRQHDYFLIENIEPYQLTKLAQTSQMRETSERSNRVLRHQEHQSILTSTSSDQMHTLTSRFILLENTKHFDHICNHSRQKNLHFIKLFDNTYFLVRSSNPESVKRHILNDEIHMSETAFLNTTSQSFPVIIYDTPGMGKSVILTNLAYQLKQKMSSEYVIYFEVQDLVNRLLSKKCKIDAILIKSEILDIISTNKFGAFINKELFNKPRQIINLFLDGYDEVNAKCQETAINVIKILNEHTHSFKIYITSRPHHRAILEKTCGVIGYGILPFELQEQINFLVEYWQKQYDVESSKEIEQFATNLLSVFRDKISSKDREITGIPLQCRMLADVYARDAQNKLYSLKNSRIVLNTISDMYREYFCQKFPNTLLQPGQSQMLDLHFKLALDVLFPGFLEGINYGQGYENHGEIFAIGIIELNKSGKQQFVHRTFAEFLVSEFVGSFMYIEQIVSQISMQEVLKLCSSQVLGMVEFELDLPFFKVYNGESSLIKFKASKFKLPTLAFFFNHNIFFHMQQSKIPIFHDVLCRYINLGNQKQCCKLVMACIESNVIEIYKLVTSLPRTYFIHDLSKHVNESKMPFIEFSLLLASQLASVDLLKLHYAFISSLVEKPLTDLKHEIKSNGKIHQSHLIICAAQQGNYHNFEFIFNDLKPYKVQFERIIYSCLNASYTNGSLVVSGKLQILKFLFSNTSITNVNIKHVSMFSFEKVHVELLLFLFAQGVDSLKIDKHGDTIAHRVASYLSADEYHKFVEWLVQNNISSIFKLKNFMNKTAVHFALDKIELKSETLQLLANRCNINFNEKNEDGVTEFVYAIRSGRSVSFLETLVELGADINTRDKEWCGVLCHSIKCTNIPALKYFLSLGVNPNKRCQYYLCNIWEHVLKSGNISKIATLLMQNGADINSVLITDEGNACCPFQPASILLKNANLGPECVSTLIAKKSFVGNVSSCMWNFCWLFCLFCLSLVVLLLLVSVFYCIAKFIQVVTTIIIILTYKNS